MRPRRVQLTHWMCDVLESLENGNSEQVIEEVKGKVLEICGALPRLRLITRRTSRPTRLLRPFWREGGVPDSGESTRELC